MAEPPDRPDLVANRRAFALQAEAFEDRRFKRTFTTDAAWVFERLRCEPEDLVLDVAAGTGHAARQLAASVRAVVALDATDEMLARGCAAARAEGHRNIVFVRGDAAALPFPDAGFDVVVCRFALHHFHRPAVQLSEMRRCLRRGGRLAVADVIVDSDPRIAAVQNELERMRDPSHVRMLSAEELRALVRAAGFAEPGIEIRTTSRPLTPWLEQARAAPRVAEQIRHRLADELQGGSATGFAPRLVESELWFSQTFASCVA